ncbi:MAG TPA: SMI1/KNR4 family protein [Chitinophaga sp.]|uniref:SMI1/KNR4 family protein n=1 Tax=Chitinophaga sp. TaxID=1869181 RepID=UPI002C1856CB|nr:SMI1/KNR4 family protein [Chitinophaga sp.]HVI47908.1 SMI1/KNR4 family protein [Chitinophaga sp.]
MAINLNEFWRANGSTHTPATDDSIAIAEQILNVKLPPLFVDLLKIQNGGNTKGYIFPTAKKTLWADDHVPFWEMYGIGESVNTTPQNILDSQYLIEEWGLPEKQVLLAGEGHWWITLDYRSSDTPSVQWLDVEGSEELLLAETFEDFINGLVADID